MLCAKIRSRRVCGGRCCGPARRTRARVGFACAHLRYQLRQTGGEKANCEEPPPHNTFRRFFPALVRRHGYNKSSFGKSSAIATVSCPFDFSVEAESVLRENAFVLPETQFHSLFNASDSEKINPEDGNLEGSQLCVRKARTAASCAKNRKLNTAPCATRHRSTRLSWNHTIDVSRSPI